MSRTVAMVWHTLFSIAAGVLYFFFVLPRWPELVGDTSHTLGTVMRIVAGALIGLAALPVVFTLIRTRQPEFGTPKLALRLRVWSIALHVLGGVLIIGTAISEIWLSLDDVGRWLFGVYGAAAAIFLLGVFAFYLAFVAELPPPPPRQLKTKAKKQRRRKRKGKAEAAAEEEAEVETETEVKTEAEADVEAEAEAEPKPKQRQSSRPRSPSPRRQPKRSRPKRHLPRRRQTKRLPKEQPTDDEPAAGGLRNRRPSGKSGSLRRRRRLRGGVAVEE